MRGDWPFWGWGGPGGVTEAQMGQLGTPPEESPQEDEEGSEEEIRWLPERGLRRTTAEN